MKLAVLVAVLLIVGAVVAVVARRRSVDESAPTSDLDAEADANRWVVRLGGSLDGIDVRAQAGAGGSAARSLTDATECLRTARAQLAKARTPHQYAQVTRTAVEGLHHVQAARTALGTDAGPGAGPTGGGGSGSGATGQVEVPPPPPAPAPPVRTAISRPLDQASRVVRKSERPSRTASRSVTAAS